MLTLRRDTSADDSGTAQATLTNKQCPDSLLQHPVQSQHDMPYIAAKWYSPSIMHCSTVGRVGLRVLRHKLEKMKVTGQETLSLVVSHKVEPSDVML